LEKIIEEERKLPRIQRPRVVLIVLGEYLVDVGLQLVVVDAH